LCILGDLYFGVIRQHDAYDYTNMNILFSILAILGVVLVFNFIIFVHELGHFWAAKWRGMQVDRFQIWFGKPIWKKTIDGVQWGLGTIPLGGFVSLPEMAPMEAIEGEKLAPKESGKKITPLDKIIVAAAGPLFSFLLAFAAACIVWKVGRAEFPVTSTEIGYVQADSPAEKAGLKAGDTIVEIAGQRPATFDGKFDAVTTMIALSAGELIEIKVERPGVEGLVTVNCGYEIPETSWYERKAMRRIGIAPKQDVFIGSVIENSPAAKAGLQQGDQITKVNGQPATSFLSVQDMTKESAEAVLYTILREGETREVSITPVFPRLPKDYDRKLIGINFAIDNGAELFYSHPNPFDQMTEAGTFMWKSLQAVANRKTSLDVQHFSGPIGIGKQMYDLLTIKDGWRELIWFLVIFNVNLAIFNLLPFPVLDGGHIVLSIAEWVRGRPAPLKILEVIQTAFVAVLFSLFLFISSKDLGDNFGKVFGGKPKSTAPQKIEF